MNDCGAWVISRSEIQGDGSQNGEDHVIGRLELIGMGQSSCPQVIRKESRKQDGLWGHGLKFLSANGISSLFFGETSVLISRSFNWFDQAHSD